MEALMLAQRIVRDARRSLDERDGRRDAGAAILTRDRSRMVVQGNLHVEAMRLTMEQKPATMCWIETDDGERIEMQAIGRQGAALQIEENGRFRVVEARWIGEPARWIVADVRDFVI